MKNYINPPKDQWTELTSRPNINSNEIVPLVNDILNKVKANGDAAVKELTLKFDGTIPSSLKVSDAEINEALLYLDNKLQQAMHIAASNIECFHSLQLPQVIRTETSPGVECWQKAVPINSVGLYIPGGTAPLFSTVLMLAIPARIAQCKNVILCTPPDKDGNINQAILYAAKLCGITDIYKIGGAQAIAAMAYGTETIPKADKIFGPGNQYVTTAKQLVSAEGIAIDMPAGPSEVMLIADETTPAEFAAADLLSQAEHGTDSQVILLASDAEKVDEIMAATQKQLDDLPRKDIAIKALENSRALIFENDKTLIEFMNIYAPEHLILLTKNAEDIASQVKQAGSVFIGNYTPESAGDYASGTNHTLPTNGFASAYSGVNMDSYMKKITFQQISPEGLKNIGPVIETMAEAEFLQAHKNAVSVRLEAINIE